VDAVDIAPRDMPSDDLQTAIQEAQATLQQGGNALMPHDPLRFVMAGLSHLLGVLGRSTRRWERAVADVIAARAPLTDDDRAGIHTAIEDGAFRGMKVEARRVIRTLDRRLAVLIGLSVAGAFVLGAAPGVIAHHFAWSAGYAAGEERAVHLEAAIGRTLTKDDADGWLMLMQNNEIAAVPRACASQGGRLACTFVFWDAPAQPPGVPTQQQTTVKAVPPAKRGN
jgi:hypothetical protein